jgi:serine/threonine protein kinase/WD40 repeat protein
MNSPSDTFQLDEHLARLLAAFDPRIDGADGHAPTIGVAPPGPLPGERPITPLPPNPANEGSLGELLPDPGPPPHPPAPGPPSGTGPHRVGRFELRRQLGKGGCGIVFLAYDPKLEREVALKIPRPEMLLSPDARRRLVREALAAAGFDHPNLVPVYESGEVGPVCFIATAFCPGLTLGEWLDRQTYPVPVRQAARLLAVLAEAVQHAHDRGVLHRDLKPNNVILQGTREDPEDQEPPPGAVPLRGEHFVPRVVDFGLAKLLERGGPAETGTRQILGTPKYMAPEQAQARHDDVGPAADVYALGVILYELLTGRAPYEGNTDVEVLRQAIEGDPTPPRHLRPDLPRDLEAICLKAMDRSPARRYRTAIDYADDLRRFLDGKPTLARPLRWPGRAAKWMRRNDQAVAIAVVTTIASVLLALGWWSVGERRYLKSQLSNARIPAPAPGPTRAELRQAYARAVRTAYLAWRAGDVAAAKEAAADARRLTLTAGDKDDDFALRHLARLLAGERLTVPCPAGAVTALAVSGDGRLLASGHADGTLAVWDRATGNPVGSARAHDRAVAYVGFESPAAVVTAAGAGDGRRWPVAAGGLGPGAPAPGVAVPECGPVAVARHGSAVFTGGDDGVIRGWDAADGGLQAADGWPRAVVAVGVRSDGAGFVAAAADGSADEVRAGSGRVRRAGAGAVLLAVRVQPTGAAVGVVADGSAAAVREVGGAERGRFAVPDGAAVASADLSADGRGVAVGDDRGRVFVWDPDGGPPAAIETGLRGPVRRVSLSADGKLVAAPCPDGVKVWRVGLPDPEMTVAGEDGAVFRLCPGGDRLVTAGRGVVRVWAAGGGPREEWALHGHVGRVTAVGVSPDGRTVVSGGADGSVRCWDGRTGQELLAARRHAGAVAVVEFSADGRTLVTAGAEVAVWDGPPPPE